MHRTKGEFERIIGLFVCLITTLKQSEITFFSDYVTAAQIVVTYQMVWFF